jgi:23S rRNA pseudouridine1911/1915/1917 synthase
MISNLYEYSVALGEDRSRLDRFLASRLGSISRMRIARIISEGGCRVNGELKDSGYKVSAGDAVAFRMAELGPTAMTPENIPLEIIFEDDHIAVVAKPAGMLVHPTLGVKSGTLANALTYHFNSGVDGGLYNGVAGGDQGPADIAASCQVRPGIVHRLDKATSGLLVVAKTPHALSVLSKHFRKGMVQKRYLAVVRGEIKEPSGSINAPIGRDSERRPQWWVMETGRPSETRWQALGSGAGWTALELEPVTGRTNQLRIHCAYDGHPILGDNLYDDKFDTQTRDNQPSQRLLLHAWKIEFYHPKTGVRSEFIAPVPAEITRYLDSIN